MASPSYGRKSFPLEKSCTEVFEFSEEPSFYPRSVKRKIGYQAGVQSAQQWWRGVLYCASYLDEKTDS